MGRLIFLIFVIPAFYAMSQQYQEVHITELDIVLVGHSTMHFSILEEPLNGNFKLNNYKAGDYTLATFVEGKIHGVSKNYKNNSLIGANEYANGLENGESLGYDGSGNVFLRVGWKEGKLHGEFWHKENGLKYYLQDKEVTKKEYHKYLIDQKDNRR